MERATGKKGVMKRMNEQDYLVGIDVGSTTVKVAIMDQVGEILYKSNMDILKARADLEKQGTEIAR